ncbi:Fungal protease inhibitor-1 [Eumeta japonica]|uniref:Fungal protease inhibitor-1 n=1 Tax=Eumeta variegata TaxID=151549 RepID=A0A4C1U6E2_EUMVA|nr:Fungal protease inhibitor-1 [Eumeta japonica]
MKVIVALALLVCTVAVVRGDLVCGTNYCKQHPCTSPVARSSCRSPSEYRASHAGKCACCPACVTLLSEGAACKTYSKELGETPSAVCREPLKCLNAVCTRVPSRKSG